MAKPPPKLSGLIKSGAVVPATPIHGLADIPAQTYGELPVRTINSDSQLGAIAGMRNLQQIPVDLIDPNPLAPREVYTPEMISSRAEELRLQGQHDPIHVILHPNIPGRFIVCDGWTRVQACREYKIADALFGEVHPNLNLQQAAWFGYEQNECREQHCDLDRAMFYEKLIADGESATEIARRAKISKTLMSFYRAYAKLPQDVLEIAKLHSKKIGATEAYQLARLHDSLGIRKTLALVNRYISEDQSQRWLVNQVQGLLNPSAKKPNLEEKIIRFANGVYKRKGDSFELNITVSAQHRDAFSEGLEKLLEMAAIHQKAPAKQKNVDEPAVEAVSPV